MSQEENAEEVVRSYFEKHNSGTARDIYYTSKRSLSHSSICDALDTLHKAGELIMHAVPASKYRRAHYVFTKVTKHASLLKRLFDFIFRR